MSWLFHQGIRWLLIDDAVQQASWYKTIGIHWAHPSVGCLGDCWSRFQETLLEQLSSQCPLVFCMLRRRAWNVLLTVMAEAQRQSPSTQACFLTLPHHIWSPSIDQSNLNDQAPKSKGRLYTLPIWDQSRLRCCVHHQWSQEILSFTGNEGEDVTMSNSNLIDYDPVLSW